MMSISFLSFLLLITYVASTGISHDLLNSLIANPDNILFISFTNSLTGDENDQYKQQIENELEAARSLLQRDGMYGSKIRIESIYVDKYPEVYTQFNLKTLPIFGIFRDGFPKIYEGQRSSNLIYTFLKNLATKNSLLDIDSKTFKNQFNALKSVRVVGYFTNTKSKEYKSFEIASRHFQEDIPFAITSDSSIAKSFKLSKEGQVTIVKPSEKNLNLGSFTSAGDLINAVTSNRKGLWLELTYNNVYRVWNDDDPLVCAFVRNYDDKNVLSAFTTVAKELKDEKLKFVLVSSDSFPEFIKRVGLDDNEIPTIGIIDAKNSKEFFIPDSNQISASTFKRWMKQFLADKLVPNVPELYPAAQYLLSHKNFNQAITNGRSDVLIQFFDKTNDACRGISAFYDSLSQLLNPTGNVFVAVFNSRKYGAPNDLEIKKYPTFLYYKANDPHNPVEYHYNGDITSLLPFIAETQTTLTEEEKISLLQIYQQSQEKRDPESDVHVEL